MRTRKAGWLLLGAVVSLYAFQRPFRQYYTRMYEDFPIPPDYQEKTEWVFGRLIYPDGNFGRGGFGRGGFGGGGFGRRGGFGRDWREGFTGWTTDYPRSDRHFVQAVRRLTRVHTRSVEQGVNPEDGDQYDWPWLYGVEVGHWDPPEDYAKLLREYFDRGGFLMVDDFHGPDEWAVFEAGMRRVFPDRQIVEIADDDAIFHLVYDLQERYQVPGVQYWRSGVTWEHGGITPHWRAIYDDKGRIMVAICFNQDLGDSWEWADDPNYLEKYSALGIRIGVNNVVYAMTH
jgi:hypothetical protein